MYLTYDEYLNMGGNLTESAFNRYARMAEAEINRQTFGRVIKMASVPSAVKDVMFELIELNETITKSRNGKTVASESVDSWSRSYSSASVAEHEQSGNDLLLTYLSGVTDDNGVPLLYRGVGK